MPELHQKDNMSVQTPSVPMLEEEFEPPIDYNIETEFDKSLVTDEKRCDREDDLDEDGKLKSINKGMYELCKC